MANMTQHLPHGAEALKVIEQINAQFDATVDWQRAEAMMAQWGGKFMLKGIQSVEDAVMAADMGASGIIISNHGGRQLDGSPSTLSLLPEIVAAVGHRTEVLLDGGIERGSDVVKALALGAKGVLMGKAYLYGLAAGGEEGVARSYAILRDEMERVMRLIGVSSLQELNASHVRKVE
jgi:L-lactate dehydrogenase (cytochrome)